jgi:hypothetical protein
MSGARSRNKGATYERSIVNTFRAVGFDASRVPLSGMGHEKRENGEFAGDIVLPWLGRREKFEAKKRSGASGFKQLYLWLGKHRGLFTAGDRKETLVVLRMSDFLELYKAAHPSNNEPCLPEVED